MDSPDSQFNRFPNSVNGFNLHRAAVFPHSNEYPNFENGAQFNFGDASLNINVTDNQLVPPEQNFIVHPQSSSVNQEGVFSSHSDDNDFSETVLKYISQILMEEDMEDKPCMFHDPLALQATEKSLYGVLGESYPLCSDQSSPYNVGSSVDFSSSGFNDFGRNSSSSSRTSHLVDPSWSGDYGELKPSLLQMRIHNDFVFESTSESSSQSSRSFQNSFATKVNNGWLTSSVSELLVPNLFSENELMSQFNRGVEEASKFLPKVNLLGLDLESNTFAPELKENALTVVGGAEKDEREQSAIGLRGKKNHEREDPDLEEERSNKQSAIYIDECELSEMFDRVLIGNDRKDLDGTAQNDGAKKILQKNRQTNGSRGDKNRAKKPASTNEVVDLTTLLLQCAQAVSAGDRRTAGELLKQVRQHSSPSGDGTQRLAHYLANGLDARLDGTGMQIYTALCFKKQSAVEMIKAYQVYIEASPFNKIAIIFANHIFQELAEKATTLHIIDFGILYGFQWPALIFRLSKQNGGPPKLRITGIELPQRGFRPAERVEETGRRLARYCERFNVPFEYNAIAKKWENIQIEDLKIEDNEVLAVNCLYRFKNLLDETVAANSPRDAVLNLIRRINPDIFIHAVLNASFNSPFFISRFREALFYFSALFDAWETIVHREDEMRLMFEKEFYGREIVNVVACEGLERIERPETYKQWTIRNTRAGFRQLPLDPRLMKKLRGKLKAGYSNDFTFDEDRFWMLQGWKGKILYASSAWVPA